MKLQSVNYVYGISEEGESVSDVSQHVRFLIDLFTSAFVWVSRSV